MAKINIYVITAYSEAFPGILGSGVIGRALRNKLWNLEVFKLHDFGGAGKNPKIDDKPFGGGAGMVIMPTAAAAAVDHVLKKITGSYEIIFPSPRGKVFNYEISKEIVKKENLIFFCGRFEGIDERFLEYYKVTELSIGDYILSGGEVAAMVILESSLRNIPGVLGNHESLNNETFRNDLLEHPHYTRPFEWRGMKVPEILISGNHQNVAKWRMKSSHKLTEKIRPDLWKKYTSKKS